jgi:hypothetical protein
MRLSGAAGAATRSTKQHFGKLDIALAIKILLYRKNLLALIALVVGAV